MRGRAMIARTLMRAVALTAWLWKLKARRHA